MGSLIAGVLDGLGLPAGLAGDTAPYVPSAPVEIGTRGPRRGVAEIGSWQGLMVMFAVVLVLGTVVLMYVVRQRARLLERRRVRRMAQAAAQAAAFGVEVEFDTLTPPPPPRTTPATPGRPAPNA